MAEPTIEEAWANLAYLIPGNWPRCEESARALARAALQATLDEHKVVCDRLCDTLKRILALGRDDGDTA